MSLNQVASGERVHIGFFGLRNAGKSSLMNAVTGQQLAVVSDVKGTTTDPVKKAMELLPIGPVVVIDTPGIDDEGGLGELRVKKTREVLAKTHVAVLVADCTRGLTDYDNELIAEFRKREVPFVVVYNKCDLLSEVPATADNEIYVSAVNGTNVYELKERIGSLAKAMEKPRYIVGDLLSEDSIVVLVTPIDESAPKGRLILPQQLTLRELLDFNCTAIVCQVEQLAGTLSSLSRRPDLVITDSQAFGQVSKIVPQDVVLTSFSILMARYKGELSTLVEGAVALKNLTDDSKVLVSEGCTHHRQCNDIGTVKIPGWIKEFANAEPEFHFTSGGEFPEDLCGYDLVVHCGGCMLNEKEMKNRIRLADEQGKPIVNYGVGIAYMNGILKRSLQLFPDLYNRI
ncbi:MAG: [Clostridia bacterium]|nr:[FeFe] hydrogenase H-cluster maturation GTPase HydF [Clostridia bacterium]